jgi:hypothetical protein
MAKALDVLNHVSDFLAHRASLLAFEDWSASYLRGVYIYGDAEDQSAIHAVRSVLNAFEDESEERIRQELAAAMRPFGMLEVLAVAAPSIPSTVLVPAGLQVSWKFDQPIVHRASQNDSGVLFLRPDAPVVYIDVSPQIASPEWRNVVYGDPVAWVTSGNSHNSSFRVPPQRELRILTGSTAPYTLSAANATQMEELTAA